MSARRAAAIGALLLGFGGFALAVVVAVQEFPRGLIALACVALAAVAASYGVMRRGAVRVAGLSVGVLGLGAAIVLLVSDRLLEQALVVGALVLSGACARAAFGVRVHLPQVAAPRRPVLFFNPKSGGGKAERFSVAAEARARGIGPQRKRIGPDDIAARGAVPRRRSPPTAPSCCAATGRAPTRSETCSSRSDSAAGGRAPAPCPHRSQRDR